MQKANKTTKAGPIGANFGSGFLVGVNDKDDDQQLRAHQKLLWAVVTLAVQDACKSPLCMGNDFSPTVPQPDAQSAIRFLMTEHSDGYFMWLNVDGAQFRKRLVEFMYKKEKTPMFRDIERRNFRYTYQWFYNLQANNMTRFVYD